MIKLLNKIGKAFFCVCLILVFSSLARADVMPGVRTFTFRIRDEPETLDWNRAHTVVEAYLLMNLMEGLVTFDSSMKAIPALAQDWSLSSDRKVYRFRIRRGVKWSDGVELKAKDFVYSWKRLLSPMTSASYAYLLFDVEGAEKFSKGELLDFEQVGVKAIDDYTFEVKLIQPVAHWIYIPAFWVTFPLREDIVAQNGNGWTVPGRMVNLGPYSLVSHDIGSRIVMRANGNYYGPRGNVDWIHALIVKDDQTALSLYDAGKLDFLTDLGTVDSSRILGRKDLKVLPHLKTGYLAFTTGVHPVSNSHLRRAIGMAIDRKKLSQILQGKQEPATSFVPPTMLGYSKNLGLPFDLQKARAELRTGVENTGSIKLTYIFPNWDKSSVIANFIKTQLESNLKISVNLQPLDNPTYRAQLDLGTFALFDATWTADYPDSDNFLSVFTKDSGNSRTGWKNDRYDELVKKARQAERAQERSELYVQAQKILLQDEAVIIPLYYEPNLALVHARVKSFELNPMDYLYLRNLYVSP